ncbi:MAG: hypothetical protein LBC67_07025 [Spirochaetales bacterium]|jgi:uncharacterized membrane protein YeaQ/YmgE (transglycosylase-associated protein family)|nr:hypothetical protein [Spirochaetales bacterium]
MENSFITIGLIYILIGFGEALIFHYVLKKRFIGGVWGAVFVGIAGSFTGGFLDIFLGKVWFSAIFVSVNIIPPLVFSCLFLWLFYRISNSPEEY